MCWWYYHCIIIRAPASVCLYSCSGPLLMKLILETSSWLLIFSYQRHKTQEDSSAESGMWNKWHQRAFLSTNWWFSSHVLNIFNLNNHSANRLDKKMSVQCVTCLVAFCPEIIRLFFRVLWAGARNRLDIQISRQMNSIVRASSAAKQEEECHRQLPPEMFLPHDWTYWISKQKGPLIRTERIIFWAFGKWLFKNVVI